VDVAVNVADNGEQHGSVLQTTGSKEPNRDTKVRNTSNRLGTVEAAACPSGVARIEHLLGRLTAFMRP